MNRAELTVRLAEEKTLTVNLFGSIGEAAFFVRPQPEKWSPAEVVQHLVLSVRPLVLAHSLPLFVLRVLFGTPNRRGRTYEELVERYRGKLAAGGRASGPFIPGRTGTGASKEALLKKLNKAYDRYTSKVSRVNESDFDRYLLPHPLLGKLTLREMTYFTIYHLEHHRNAIK
jgi:hypothetical protein